MNADFFVGGWLVEPSLGRMSQNGRTVLLRAKVMDLLVFLAAHPGQVVSKDQLLDGVWGTDAISESALTVTIAELRQAFAGQTGDAPLIETIPKRGYRLIPPVSHVPSVGARRERRWAGIAAVFVLAIGATALVRWGEDGERPADGASINPAFRVAVLPFSYRGDPAHAYLAAGMTDLLSASLDGAGPLTAVEPRAVLGLLAQRRTKSGVPVDSAEPSGAHQTSAHAIAQRLSFRLYVLGDIVEARGRMRISARLYETTDVDVRAAASVEGEPDGIFQLVDDLTGQFAIGAGAARGSRLAFAARPTTSVQALKAFLQGEQFYRGGDDRRTDAHEAYQRATALDERFAIAWYRLSQLAYLDQGDSSGVIKFAEMAVRHGAGLPWRERRLLEANLAYARGDVKASEQTYRELLRKHPNDVEALFGLSLLLDEYGWLIGGPPTAFIEPNDAFLAFEPRHTLALEGQRNGDLMEGRCDRVPAINRALGIERASSPLEVFCGGESGSEEQQRMLQEMRTWPLQDLRLARLRLTTISQDPRTASALSRILDEREVTPQHQAVARLFLAEQELALGHRAAAVRQFARLGSVNPSWALVDEAHHSLAPHITMTASDLRAWRDRLERWNAAAVPAVISSAPRPGRSMRHNGLNRHLRAYLLGRFSARLHEYDAALGYANELARMENPEPAGSLRDDLVHAIRAHVFAEQGRHADALRELESAPRVVPFTHRAGSWASTQPQERFLRAELLERLGRHQEALWWFQSVSYRPDAVLAGPSHLRQAELHERLRQPEKAAAHYQRLVSLWRDCDEEFAPMLEKARAALKRLEGDRQMLPKKGRH